LQAVREASLPHLPLLLPLLLLSLLPLPLLMQPYLRHQLHLPSQPTLMQARS
jgi:hypothetical protein